MKYKCFSGYSVLGTLISAPGLGLLLLSGKAAHWLFLCNIWDEMFTTKLNLNFHFVCVSNKLHLHKCWVFFPVKIGILFLCNDSPSRVLTGTVFDKYPSAFSSSLYRRHSNNIYKISALNLWIKRHL